MGKIIGGGGGHRDPEDRLVQGSIESRFPLVVPENTSFWLVICAREEGIQLIPKIAAGTRDGGPF